MYDKNKDKKFYRTEELSFKFLLFDSIGKSQIYNPIKKSMVELYCKNNLLVVALDGIIFNLEGNKCRGSR